MIRPARAEDIPHLHRLLGQVELIHHEGRPDIFRGPDPDGSPRRKYSDDELALILKDENTPVFVYDTGGYVAGYAFTAFKQVKDDNILVDSKTLYIDDICIDETARGAGIGRALYEYAEEFARKNGCSRVELRVWTMNEPALSFYQKMGMKPLYIYMEKQLRE
jgi:ribosomal protein S18 acetylase RimI-like enzyme